MTPKTPTPEVLAGFLTNLITLTAALPLTHLSKKKRAALGPHLFTRARELTDAVALILRRRPAVFPEYPTAAAEIDEDQQAADQYLELHHLFSYLAQACLVSHQHHQSRAVLRSKEILRAVLASSKHPCVTPHLRHQRRLSLLTPAFNVLFGFRRPPGEGKVKVSPEEKAARDQARRNAQAQRQRAADRMEHMEEVLGPIVRPR